MTQDVNLKDIRLSEAGAVRETQILFDSICTRHLYSVFVEMVRELWVPEAEGMEERGGVIGTRSELER